MFLAAVWVCLLQNLCNMPNCQFVLASVLFWTCGLKLGPNLKQLTAPFLLLPQFMTPLSFSRLFRILMDTLWPNQEVFGGVMLYFVFRSVQILALKTLTNTTTTPKKSFAGARASGKLLRGLGLLQGR